MKFFIASFVACVVVATVAAGVALDKRFFTDILTKLVDGVGNTVDHAVHAVLDPLASGVHVLVDEFNHLVHGSVDIVTVTCRLPIETTGTRDERITDCTSRCLANANSYLGEVESDSVPSACSLACKYALDHRSTVSC